uniref:Homing endonuclease LAGLIDADG domain-containing protein n=1 Tax=Pseudocodium devriesii TaxID=453070 RepID=A0A386B126_9CHLO|nr:hypothetical protein [Pseudocodium devriesii]AYC65390.1 hypothetical protein [Pseudocodium devriesii]
MEKKHIKFRTRYQHILNKFQTVPPPITNNYKYFLAGFIEGEGSICVSVKQTNGIFKMDPEFNICQHESGILHLVALMHLFKTGNIELKSGSRSTYVYKMTNRQSLKEKFVPYYKKYVWPSACEMKRGIFQRLCEILDLFEQKVHHTPKGLALKILPLVYQINSSQGKRTKYRLEHLQAKILMVP